MTGSTKILTVSYGTFSCTLEGFDDPFGTMRGIAEYFRDLAADDRYFGAEPPTPDVEMLQRIAEKEVQRRVEARLGDSGVALTQLTGAKEDKAADEADSAEDVAEKVAERVAETPARPVSQPRPEPVETDFDHGPLAHEDEYLLSDEPEDVLAVDPDARPPAQGPAETVAEKLRRIRAVVSRSIEPEAGDDRGSFSEPQARSASDVGEAPKRERALTETIRQITDDLADDDDDDDDAVGGAHGAANLFDEADDDADDLNADDPDTDDADTDDADGFEAVAEAAEAAAEEEPEVEDTPVASAAPAAEAWDTVEEEDAGDGWDFDTEGLPAATAEDDDDSDTDDDSASDDAVLAKVMARDDGPEDDGPENEGPENEGPETETPDVLKLDQESAVAASGDEPRASRPLTPISDTNGDVKRLLAETDNHLKDDEGIRRRRVISQMRAAVAATKADRLVSRRVQSREADDAADQERYRDDLNEVVRDATRPLPGKETDRRLSAAPLVLVSSQRVDGEASRTTKPDTTRDADEPEGFAGFARNMGARELSELLEAAAAYTAFVEGQSSFSRPEIMKRVARVDPTLKLSREDGLRSFGQLLRQGTFRKLERGQFTIAETTRFKPEQRIAGE